MVVTTPLRLVRAGRGSYDKFRVVVATNLLSNNNILLSNSESEFAKTVVRLAILSQNASDLQQRRNLNARKQPGAQTDARGLLLGALDGRSD